MASALKKFMQSLDDRFYEELRKIAESRGISIQELIRAIVVPEWLESFRKRSPSA